MRAKAAMLGLALMFAFELGLVAAPQEVSVKTLSAASSEAQSVPVTEAQRKAIMAAAKALKPEDIPTVRRKAEAGDPEAQVILGLAYDWGTGAEKDPARAFGWYQKAAAQSHPMGQNLLGLLYATGRGVARNDAEAVEWFRKAAEQGYSGGQSTLGWAYYLGRGVPKDPGEAVTWLRKAAEQGNESGQCWLGMAYGEGQGVTKDYREALSWIRKAADQGDPLAEYNLAQMYDYGLGVAKDSAEAARWCQKAADQGDPVAEYKLAQMYDYGLGVAKDSAEAARWYQKAADQGLPVAQFDLAIAHHNGEGVRKDKTEAVKWFRKASDQGWAPASFYLGKMFLEENLAPRLYGSEIAMGLFEKAATQGYPLGALALADIYSSRWKSFVTGVPRDDAKTCTWLLVARELDGRGEWARNSPQDMATVKKELPERISKIEKKLKGDQFSACERSAAEWLKGHSPNAAR